MNFNLKTFNIWQKTIVLEEEINKRADVFSRKERDYLCSLIRRTADAIALNIRKGSIGELNTEFKRFMGYSIRSLAKIATFDKYYKESYNIMNLIVAFKNNLH